MNEQLMALNIAKWLQQGTKSNYYFTCYDNSAKTAYEIVIEEQGGVSLALQPMSTEEWNMQNSV